MVLDARQAWLVNQRGQEIGPKGFRTRRRILDATQALIERTPFRDITAMEVARESRTSVATFYIYFSDVLGAVEALAADLLANATDFTGYFTRSWSDPAALPDVRAFIEAYIDDALVHYPVIRVRNQLADEGDTRFSDIRSSQAQPVVEALARQIGGLSAPDPASLERAKTSARLLLSMLDRLGALLMQQPYRRRKLGRAQYVEASANIVVATVQTFTALERAR